MSHPIAIAEHDATDWNTLIDNARNGCDTSLGKIADSVHGYLLTVAANGLATKLQPKFSASDVVQISLIEAQEGIEKFRGSTQAEILSWLKKIVIHNLTDEAKRYTRTRSREVSREIPIDSAIVTESNPAKPKTPSVIMSRHESDVQLTQAVNQLPPRQRFVVTARFRDGLGYPEIAQNLQVTEAAARQLWSRAAVKLRYLLEQPH